MVKALNVIQHPADQFDNRKCFAWSNLVGGKQAEDTLKDQSVLKDAY